MDEENAAQNQEDAEETDEEQEEEEEDEDIAGARVGLRENLLVARRHPQPKRQHQAASGYTVNPAVHFLSFRFPIDGFKNSCAAD